MKKSPEEIAFANRWKGQTKEFLCNPYFLNTAPSVPAGPFFKKIDLNHKFEDFADYHLSSLEKNYVWRPHINGVKCLDIVDQDALVMGAVSTSSTDGMRSGRNATSAIPWLKKTLHLTNNLSENVNNFKGDEGIDAGYKAKAERVVGDNEGPFTERSIEKSFKEIEKKTEDVLKLQKENKGKGNIEWMAPLLPDDALWGSELSLLRFDKDPTREGSAVVFSDAHILNSIVTNIRSLPDSKGRGNNSKKHAVSMVVPAEEDPELFHWARDYCMDVLGVNVEDSYLFTLDGPNSRPVVCYTPLRSKLELKRMTRENCSEHTATVKRRPASATEEISSKRLRAEIAPSDDHLN